MNQEEENIIQNKKQSDPNIQNEQMPLNPVNGNNFQQDGEDAAHQDINNNLLIENLQPKERVIMENFEQLKQADKGGTMQRFIMFQLKILLAIFFVIFVSYDYQNEYIFIFINNGINGFLFAMMQVLALQTLIHIKVEAVPPEDRENFEKLTFSRSNKVLQTSIVVISIGISLIFGKLMWDETITKTVLSLFVFYLVMLACTYFMATIWYSTYLKITDQQEEHIKESESAKDFVIPGIDPHCYQNFQRDYKQRQEWVQTQVKRRLQGRNQSEKMDNNPDHEDEKDQQFQVFKFINPMITTDNIFGTYIYLATCTAALCACFYFEAVFLDFESRGPYSSIGAYVLYPLISYFAQRISENVLLSQLTLHNNIKMISFMAIGYRIAFIRMDDRMRNILIVTKFLWKIMNYLAFPLFLKGIIEKIKKAFYESDAKKNTKDIEQYQNIEKTYKEKFSSKFFFMQVKEMVYALAFIICGVIFNFIITMESWLRGHYKERGFDTYVMYWALDFVSEFLVLMIVSVFLKKSGFFVTFSQLINSFQIRLHSKLGLIQDLYDSMFGFCICIYILENNFRI